MSITKEIVTSITTTIVTSITDDDTVAPSNPGALTIDSEALTFDSEAVNIA